MYFRLITYLILIFGSLASYCAAKDVLDLTDHDWEAQRFVELNGSWQYAESCLSVACDSTVDVDVTKNRVDQLGYPDFGYGTYYFQFLVDHSKHFMLKIPDYFSGYEIYVNDELVGKVGKPGITEELTKPGRKVLYIPLYILQSDTVNLRIPIANFVHHKRGMGNKPISIGLQSDILHQKFLDDSYDTFLTGFLILATFFFLGLFFHGRQDYSILFFALFTLSYAYRIVGWHNYVLHDMVQMPYHLGMMLEYGTFYLCGAFFALYLENLFPDEAPVYLTRIFAVLSIGWAMTTFLPIHIFTQLNTYYLYLLLIGVVMVVFIIIRAALNKRPGSMYSLYGVLGVLVIFTFKTLNYLNLIDENRIVSIAGELTFFTFQALILSRNFTENWRQGKQDAEELAKAKSDFLSVMSHEIRTPLNAVIGTAYHLMDSDPKPDQLEDLKRLKSSSDNLLALVNNVLDFNKLDSGKLELDYTEVSIRQFCQNQFGLLEPLARKKKIQFVLEIDNDLTESVLIDKTRVGQVLTNLLGNAIKFTEKGEVRFEVTKVRTTDSHLSVLFTIIDTGGGIPEADRVKIFGAFEQANSSIARQYGGAGLGLAISKRLIELMDSTIEIDSVEGVGSRFWFTLNCEIIQSKPETTAVNSQTNFDNVRVLLVEDNAMNVLIAKRQLEKWKISVVVAESGKEALIHMANLTFDLVLMDLQMPIMDGFETTVELRKMGYYGPVIALTAASVTFDELKAKSFDGMLPKPFSPADLEEKLKLFL